MDRRSRVDPQLLRWGRERRRQDLVLAGLSQPRRRARPGRIAQPVEPVGLVAATPQRHRGTSTPEPSRDLGRWQPLRREQHDPCPFEVSHRNRPDLAAGLQDLPVLLGDGPAGSNDPTDPTTSKVRNGRLDPSAPLALAFLAAARRKGIQPSSDRSANPPSGAPHYVLGSRIDDQPVGVAGLDLADPPDAWLEHDWLAPTRACYEVELFLADSVMQLARC